MKRNISFFAALLLFVIVFNALSAGPLYAYGVGFYTTGNVGRPLFGTKLYGSTCTGIDNGSGSSHVMYGIGCGFVYDSAVAANKRFNYRLNGGYENSVNSGTPFFTFRSMHKVALSNTFGFALFNNKSLRVWMGPQVEVACQFGERTWKKYYLLSSYSFNFERVTTSSRVISGLLGLGAILGININTGDLFTLSFEAGINIPLLIGQSKTEEKSEYFFPLQNIKYYPIPTSDYSGISFTSYVNGLARLSFIFRVGDTYATETPTVTDGKARLN